MGSLQVVDVPPLVKCALAMCQTSEVVALQHFSFHGSMEALVLALGLWMVRTPMADSDSQPQKPDRKGRVAVVRVRPSPRTSVVHQHCVGKTIASEDGSQALTHGVSLFIATGPQPQCKPRMIVQNRERVATSPVCREVTLEVLLPQLVGLQTLKALPRSMGEPVSWINESVTSEDRSDGARARHPLVACGQKSRTKLASSPGWMRFTNCQHRALNFYRRARRRGIRPVRKVLQTLIIAFSETPNPLVPRRRTNLKPPAQGPHVGAISPSQCHEVSPLGHLGHLFPGHDHLSMDKVMHIMVSTMFPVHTSPAGPRPRNPRYCCGSSPRLGVRPAERASVTAATRRPPPRRLVATTDWDVFFILCSRGWRTLTAECWQGFALATRMVAMKRRLGATQAYAQLGHVRPQRNGQMLSQHDRIPARRDSR